MENQFLKKKKEKKKPYGIVTEVISKHSTQLQNTFIIISLKQKDARGTEQMRMIVLKARLQPERHIVVHILRFLYSDIKFINIL